MITPAQSIIVLLHNRHGYFNSFSHYDHTKIRNSHRSLPKQYIIKGQVCITVNSFSPPPPPHLPLLCQTDTFIPANGMSLACCPFLLSRDNVFKHQTSKILHITFEVMLIIHKASGFNLRRHVWLYSNIIVRTRGWWRIWKQPLSYFLFLYCFLHHVNLARQQVQRTWHR